MIPKVRQGLTRCWSRILLHEKNKQTKIICRHKCRLCSWVLTWHCKADWWMVLQKIRKNQNTCQTLFTGFAFIFLMHSADVDIRRCFEGMRILALMTHGCKGAKLASFKLKPYFPVRRHDIIQYLFCRQCSNIIPDEAGQTDFLCLVEMVWAMSKVIVIDGLAVPFMDRSDWQKPR